ncbi:hypothetical protein [Acetobacter sp. DsW_063]|nr:hypothetical protein [Acetobacter sp. DsW_063]
MRRAVTFLVATSAILLATRLLTDVVYSHESTEAFLVFKHPATLATRAC